MSQFSVAHPPFHSFCYSAEMLIMITRFTKPSGFELGMGIWKDLPSQPNGRLRSKNLRLSSDRVTLIRPGTSERPSLDMTEQGAPGMLPSRLTVKEGRRRRRTPRLHFGQKFDFA